MTVAVAPFTILTVRRHAGQVLHLFDGASLDTRHIWIVIGTGSDASKFCWELYEARIELLTFSCPKWFLALPRRLAAKVASFLGLTALLASTVSAAEVHVFGAGGGELVFLDGEIVEGDLQRVMLAVEAVPYPIVLLRSPGGNLREGLAIARYLRSKGAVTGVAPDFLCASACALIWIGGQQRYLAPTSLIGFHAAYTINGVGRTETSGWGSALMGAFLSEIGLSETAIIYMTAAAPDELNWINRSMALALGIDVYELFPSVDVAPPGTDFAIGGPGEAVLKLPPGFRWIVLESKERSEDIAVDRWQRATNLPVMVVATQNGFTAAVVGPFEKANAEALAANLVRQDLVPQDVYLSSGNGFTLRLR